MFVLCYRCYFVCRRLPTGGTVIPVSLIAVVLTVLEKSVFCGYLAVASVTLRLPTQFVHCCYLAATRAFMPASLMVISYTILEISKFLGQLDDDDEKCQLNTRIASLRSELYSIFIICIHTANLCRTITKKQDRRNATRLSYGQEG